MIENTATIFPDGTAVVFLSGQRHELPGSGQIHRNIVGLVTDLARTAAEDIRITVTEKGIPTHLVVQPDGTVHEVPAPAQRPAPASAVPDAPQLPAAPIEASPKTKPHVEAAPMTMQERRAARASFVTRTAPLLRAESGWRGALNQVGLRLAPGAAEQSERADRLTVSSHWPGPRTIAVIQPKGGGNKTPTTICLSAVFGRYGGAGVLAVDNNQTRGTLGWRTEQGSHDATVLDLLPQIPHLLGTHAQLGDLSGYVHHQREDKFDVLRSQPVALSNQQRLDDHHVDAIHAVARKFYRLIVIDSGNDEADPMWLRMIDLADQIVVATTTRNDHAEAGALALENLAARNERSAHLADNAVVIVSQADKSATPADVARVRDSFAPISREAVTIPHDKALIDGQILFSALQPQTQRAWLAAAAAVARNF